ncbi:MAG TPA: hypothetical protein VGD58_15745 [Herpetosiphonaceae bacterium]
MPVVSDFVVIRGDNNLQIGDDQLGHTLAFNTEGRHTNGEAYLVLMVRALTQAVTNAEVTLNGERIGQIFHHNEAPLGHWFTQIINIGAGRLNDGDNNLRLGVVPNAQDGGGNFDDYLVRNIVCHFKRNV